MTIKRFIEAAIEGGYFIPPLFGGKGSQKVEGNTIVTTHKKHDGWESWSNEKLSDVNIYKVLLDPLAWQAVGKVEGWENFRCKRCGKEREDRSFNEHCGDWGYYAGSSAWEETWRYQMHRMIDALAEGKTISEFLESL